ncbi:MAG: hypothetical protein ACKVS8_07395 [Phycisphaerales bacterium]
MTSSDPPTFPDGARVVIRGHFEWPDGTTGIVRAFPAFVRTLAAEPPHAQGDFDAAGLVRRLDVEQNSFLSQWIVFDVPTDDGSGDGPYKGGEVDVQCLSYA